MAAPLRDVMGEAGATTQAILSEIESAVKNRFAALARSPEQEQRFPIGPDSAKRYHPVPRLDGVSDIQLYTRRIGFSAQGGPVILSTTLPPPACLPLDMTCKGSPQ